MSIFRKIIDRIFHHSTPAANAAPTAAPGAQQTPASGAAAAKPAAAPAAEQKLQAVDVEAVLTGLASKQGGGGNWRTSIVDLLKLLDLDSSLTARKELAQELGVRAGADGSAEQNIALHKAVMAKIAENGGKVPDSMRN